VYPQGQRGGISITSYDVKCLAPREFLNDKIIDFYLKYIFNNFLTDEQRNQTHIFGAHFYESLSNAGRNSSILENWTKYVDIFSKDFLIIPICKHHHWNLIIVCYPQLLNRDEDCDYEGKCCCILKFDSLGNNGSHSFTIIREYLSNEYALKHGSNSEFTSEKCFGMNLKVPQQHNSSDCGIYLLTYVEYFFTHPIMNFEKAKLSKETDLKNWFDYSEVKEKRKKIRKLIRDLAISNQTINADNESVIFSNYDSPMDTTESYSEMSNSFNSTRSTRGRAVKQINYYEEND
jgi:Ulp1 family protease